MILNRIFIFLLLASQILLSSCAYINAQREDVDSLITKWLSEQEFDKARNTLTKVETTHPQFLKLMLRKKEIFEKSNDFVATTIKQAYFFIKENKWEDAYTVYNFALIRVSEDKSLNFSYKSYLAKRKVYVDNLKHKLLINNAIRLINDIPVQRQIALAIKETSIEQAKFENLQKQASNTIDSLVECSSNSLKRKHTKRTKRCIQLALKLGPSKEVAKQLKQDQNKLSKLAAKKKQRRQLAESNSLTKKLNQYKIAFKNNDLITANKKLTELLAVNSNNYELIKLKTILNESINKKIKTGIESGRILYSKGSIKLALNEWLKLQKLDPENIELKSHISRAERVLRKLRTLTNKTEKNTKANGS